MSQANGHRRTRAEHLAERGWHPYRWPSFTARTGHRSEKSVMPLAEHLAAELVDRRPDLADYPETVMAWAANTARCVLLREGAFTDDDGKVINASDIDRFERRAENLGRELGLGPVGYAALRRLQAEAVTATVDLDGHMARGRELWQQRRAEIEAGGRDE